MSIVLTAEQGSAVKAIKEWFRGPEQEFYLAGYAGTGKSTLVDYIVGELGINLDQVAFCAYTGKAALVLTQKAAGKYFACTIHRLIYEVKVDKLTGQVTFSLKEKESLEHLKLIVVDEASMVDDKIYVHLKSFGIKILFVGDHGQLPPVGKGNMVAQRIFTSPDARLDTIHRQAADNPIIHLSMLARQGQMIKPGTYGGKVLVVEQGRQLPERAYLNANQIICGTNRTRETINNWYRKKLGYTSLFPVKGDKLICLKNDWHKSIDAGNYSVFLVNGMIGHATWVREGKHRFSKHPAVRINFKPEHVQEQFEDLFLLKADFLGQKVELTPEEYGLFNEFTFGYAITCHKSQGSQWERTLVFDEGSVFKENRHRWLYTAITRACDKMVLVISHSGSIARRR